MNTLFKSIVLGAVMALAACGGGSERPGNTEAGNTPDGIGWELNVNPAIVNLVEGTRTAVALTLSCTAPLTLNIHFGRLVGPTKDDRDRLLYGGAIGPKPDENVTAARGYRLDCTPARNALGAMFVSAPAETDIKTSSLVFSIDRYSGSNAADYSTLRTFAVAVVVTDAPPPPATAPPGPVLDFHASAGVTEIRLQWQAAEQAASYDIERTGPGSEVVLLRGLTSTAYIDSPLQPDSTYLYRLTAINALGSSAPVQTSARTLDAAQWVSTGSTLAAGVAPHQPSMVLDRNRLPVVAYIERLAGDVGRLYVKRFDGQVWQIVGGSALNAGSNTGASDPALALDEQDQPIIAFSQGNGTVQNIFVARYRAGAWAIVQDAARPFDPLNAQAGSRGIRPAILYSLYAGIVVAWVEDDALKVRRFGGNTRETGWQPIMAGVSMPTRLARPVVDVRLGMSSLYDFDTVSIAWIESDGADSALHVMSAGPVRVANDRVEVRWDIHDTLRPAGPSRLDQFGMFPLSPRRFASFPDGSAIPALAPTVVWADGNQPFDVFPRVWNPDARAWDQSGGQQSFGYPSARLGLMVTATLGRAASTSGFAVSYEGVGAQLGRTWVDVKRSALNQPWQDAAPSLALTTQVVGLSLQFADTTPAVATSERDFGAGNYVLQVRRYVRF